MTSQELMQILQNYPDFEVQFVFTDGHSQSGNSSFLNVRSFQDLSLADIGHSDKVLLLTGEER